MENKTTSIAITSVLLYVIFKKIYDILTTLCLWFFAKFDLYNEILILICDIIIGVFCLFILVFLFNKFLQKKIPTIKIIFSLVATAITLGITFGLINKFFGVLLADTDVDMRLFQLGWSTAIGIVFNIIALVYFIFRLYKTKPNNSN